MTSAFPPSGHVQEFLTFGEQLITEEALPILSHGYADLVESLRANEELRKLARSDGINAVLTSEDSQIVELRKTNKELATGAERDAEGRMGARVRETYRGHSVLGEELGARDQMPVEGSLGIRWVFDPVDGTTSMLRMSVAQAYGIPLASPPPAFGVTIGVLEGDEAIGGVVAQLRPGGEGLAVTRLWTGGSGVPTTCNGELVTVGPAVPLAGATLASTVPEVMFHSEAEWRDFQALDEIVGRCVTGQNCIGFMELLDPAGSVDVVFERDLTAPDTAALVPILTAAGVRVSDAQGASSRFGPTELIPSYEYIVLAAHPELHAQAVARIQSGPDGPSTFGQWKKATGVDVAKTTPNR